MFRPKGWRNPYRLEIVNSSVGGNPTAFSAFEAGADAMLEVLYKYQIGTIKEGGIIGQMVRNDLALAQEGDLILIPFKTIPTDNKDKEDVRRVRWLRKFYMQF